jgi:hypothetical protein
MSSRITPRAQSDRRLRSKRRSAWTTTIDECKKDVQAAWHDERWLGVASQFGNKGATMIMPVVCVRERK